MLAQHVVERVTLGAAESLLAEHVEEFAQGGAAAPFDLAVEFDEGNAKLLREQGAECRLAAAAQTDQRDAPTTYILGGRGKMLGHELPGFYEHVRGQPLQKLRQQHQI